MYAYSEKNKNVAFGLLTNGLVTEAPIYFLSCGSELGIKRGAKVQEEE